MKYVTPLLAGAFAFAGLASADVCEKLELFAGAVETSLPDGLPDTLILGAGESECSAVTGLEAHGLGGHRMAVSNIGCYWDNTDEKTYVADDVRDTAYHLHSCPALIFDVLEEYDEGIEYTFTYEDRTLILLGNDESGMYLDFFRVE